MSDKIEMVAIERLHPNPTNAKEHTPEQIEHLRASIRRFGFCDPIGADNDGNIIEGHGRHQAALAEGLAEVPVIRIGHLSEKEREAYAIAHNQTQLRTGFELEKLRGELGALEVSDDDFLAMGFGEDDVHFLGFNEPPARPNIDEGGEGVEETGEAPEWNHLIQQVVKTTIRFSTEERYRHFMQLVDGLGQRYPDEPQLSKRLLRFSRDYHTIG